MITKVLFGIGAALVIAATCWNFTATANMPEKYVGKVDYRLFIERFSENNDADHLRIGNKLDDIYTLLIEHTFKPSSADIEFELVESSCGSNVVTLCE